MDKVATALLIGLILIVCLVANFGCTTLQVNHCEANGGQAITRYGNLEYTGCINND